MAANGLLVFCTVPSMGSARTIAGRLVENHLAACCNIIPALKSIYEWKGSVEEDEELLLMIKTTANRYQQMQEKLQEWHPYEVPEIIAVDIKEGLPAYLQWMNEITKG